MKIVLSTLGVALLLLSMISDAQAHAVVVPRGRAVAVPRGGHAVVVPRGRAVAVPRGGHAVVVPPRRGAVIVR
jgi:hypothetical protein